MKNAITLHWHWWTTAICWKIYGKLSTHSLAHGCSSNYRKTYQLRTIPKIETYNILLNKDRNGFLNVQYFPKCHEFHTNILIILAWLWKLSFSDVLAKDITMLYVLIFATWWGVTAIIIYHNTTECWNSLNVEMAQSIRFTLDIFHTIIWVCFLFHVIAHPIFHWIVIPEYCTRTLAQFSWSRQNTYNKIILSLDSTLVQVGNNSFDE